MYCVLFQCVKLPSVLVLVVDHLLCPVRWLLTVGTLPEKLHLAPPFHIAHLLHNDVFLNQRVGLSVTKHFLTWNDFFRPFFIIYSTTWPHIVIWIWILVLFHILKFEYLRLSPILTLRVRYRDKILKFVTKKVTESSF